MPRGSYVLSGGAANEHTPEHPERTSRRPAVNGWDVEFKVWNSRAVMARAIRMQERSEFNRTHWRAMVKLGISEGY